VATMRDVARRAGVSPMTVSNVVNGHENVRPETRARVLAAITELGYRMNTAARGLRRGRSGIIAIAVSTVASPYEGMISAALAEQVARAGYDPVIELTGHRRAGELDAITHSLLRDHDGLILHSAHLDEHDLPLLRGRHPVVVLSEREYDEGFDQVLLSNVDGARAATTHLLDAGCTRPGMIGGRSTPQGHEDVLSVRAQGYRRALEDRALPLVPSAVLPAPYTFAGGAAAAHELLEEHPRTDGIFCATDVLAVGALRALHERGLRVPEDVKVIGFDGLDLGRYSTPSLSSVVPDHAALARVPVELLLTRLRGERRAEDHRREVIAFRLEERESTRR